MKYLLFILISYVIYTLHTRKPKTTFDSIQKVNSIENDKIGFCKFYVSTYIRKKKKLLS